VCRALSSTNNAEIRDESKFLPTVPKREAGMQTRILKEAGVSTNSSRVVLRNDKSQEQTEGIPDQTNKFKPANHGEAVQS
jgi:hypothetical protein